MSSLGRSTAYRELPTTPDTLSSTIDVDPRPPSDMQASLPDFEGDFEHSSQECSSVSTLDFNEEAPSSTIDISDAELRIFHHDLSRECSFNDDDENFTERLMLHDFASPTMQDTDEELSAVKDKKWWKK